MVSSAYTKYNSFFNGAIMSFIFLSVNAIAFGTTAANTAYYTTLLNKTDTGLSKTTIRAMQIMNGIVAAITGIFIIVYFVKLIADIKNKDVLGTVLEDLETAAATIQELQADQATIYGPNLNQIPGTRNMYGNPDGSGNFRCIPTSSSSGLPSLSRMWRGRNEPLGRDMRGGPISGELTGGY